MTTKNSPLSDAAICRRHRWKVGTKLRGYESGRLPATVLITAIGEQDILARELPDGYEGLWNLTSRNWRKVRT